MNLDERGRAAADELRRAFTGTERFGSTVELERLHDERLRRARRQRLRAGLVAAAITIGAIVLLASVLRDRSPVVPATQVPTGTILYGQWNPKTENARWFTANVDGSGVRDLGVTATCARWLPGGTEILITNDEAFSADHPLRPAIVQADGSNKEPLEATKDPSFNLGCGDVSPDGRFIVLEGFVARREPQRHLRRPLIRRWRPPGRERELARRVHRRPHLLARRNADRVLQDQGRGQPAGGGGDLHG